MAASTVALMIETVFGKTNLNKFRKNTEQEMINMQKSTDRMISANVKRFRSGFGEMNNIASSSLTSIRGFLGGMFDHIGELFDELSASQREFIGTQYDASGGLNQLVTSMNDVRASTGATYKEIQNITQLMVSMGGGIGKSVEEIDNMITANYKFTFATKASIGPTMAFQRSLEVVGISTNDVTGALNDLTYSSSKYGLTGKDLNAIMQLTAKNAIKLQSTYGTDAVQKYTSSLIDLGAASKRLGLDMSAATQLMQGLADNALNYVVALGSGALYDDPSKNLDKLIDKSEQIRNIYESWPPGLRNSMLKSIYGISAEQLKMLETTRQLRGDVEAFKNGLLTTGDATRDFNARWEQASMMFANISKTMEGRFKGLFNKLLIPLINRFNDIFINIGPRISKLIDRIELKIASLTPYIIEVMDYIGNHIEEWATSAMDFIESTIKDAIEWFRGIDLSNMFKEVKSVIQSIGDALKWLYDNKFIVLGAFISTKLVGGFISMLSTVKMLGGNIGALGPKLMAALGPIAVGAAIGYGIYKAYEHFSGIRKEIEQATAETKKLAEATEALNGNLSEQEKFERDIANLSKEQRIQRAESRLAQQEKEERSWVDSMTNAEAKLAQKKAELFKLQEAGWLGREWGKKAETEKQIKMLEKDIAKYQSGHSAALSAAAMTKELLNGIKKEAEKTSEHTKKIKDNTKPETSTVETGLSYEQFLDRMVTFDSADAKAAYDAYRQSLSTVYNEPLPSERIRADEINKGNEKITSSINETNKHAQKTIELNEKTLEFMEKMQSDMSIMADNVVMSGPHSDRHNRY